MTCIFVQGVTLRDGMHALQHRISLGDVRAIAGALDRAGVGGIEVTHGDGLGGGSLVYGPGSHTDAEWIEAVADVVEKARLTALALPGIATSANLREAHALGVRSVRVATHCTQAALAAPLVAVAKGLGMDVSGFLMMAHLAGPDELAGQAALLDGMGVDCVYVTDSSGHLTPRGVAERVRAVREVLDGETQIGIHAHENLSLSVANSLTAVGCGAFRVDASLAGLGAGSGNCPIEAVVAVADLEGIETHCDLGALQDAADDLVRPLMTRPVRVRPGDADARLCGGVLVVSAACGDRGRTLRRQRARRTGGVRPSWARRWTGRSHRGHRLGSQPTGVTLEVSP